MSGEASYKYSLEGPVAGQWRVIETVDRALAICSRRADACHLIELLVADRKRNGFSAHSQELLICPEPADSKG